jgi:hypothetical protein
MDEPGEAMVDIDYYTLASARSDHDRWKTVGSRDAHSSKTGTSGAANVVTMKTLELAAQRGRLEEG